MPTDSDQIAYFRLLLAEPYAPQTPQPDITGYLFSDDQLQMLLEHTESITRAAQVGWEAKASFFQSLVDVEESGASRKLSQMFRNAMQVADRYKSNADDELALLSAGVRTVGHAAHPWGPQRVWRGQSAGTYLIGDVSRAGAGGTIFFIEVPIDTSLLTASTTSGSPSLETSIPAVLAPQAVIVPTERRQGLKTEAGRSFLRQFDYYDPATGIQIDLTGWTATLKVYNAANAVLATINLAVDTSNHRFTLSLSAAQTTAFSFTTGEYEIVATNPAGGVWTLLAGTFTVSGIL